MIVVIIAGFSQGSQAQTTTVTICPTCTTVVAPGTGLSWSVPAGVTNVKVEVWGAGGGGGGANGSSDDQVERAGGGGGGGAYKAINSVSVTSGGNVTYDLGGGGVGDDGNGAKGGDGGQTSFGGAIAAGGTGGNTGNGTTYAGAGGAGATATGGDANHNGGNGGTAPVDDEGGGADIDDPDDGGGGGGGAGSTGNGGNSSGIGAGAAGAGGGGAGAAGPTGHGPGTNGSTPGGGASGGYTDTNTDDINQSGGNGAPGQIRITYTLPSNQNLILANSVAAAPGGSVSILSSQSQGGSASDQVWLAPAATPFPFTANGTTITSAAGNVTSITAPTTEGTYKLFVRNSDGNWSPASTATVNVFSQATNVSITLGATPSTELVVNWTNGTGANRLVLMRTATGSFTPQNGTNYPDNLDFGSTGGGGPDLDTDGGAEIVKSIYNGSGSGSVTVTDLVAATAYTVQVYEYTTAGNIYLVATATGNPATRSTIAATEPGAITTTMSLSAVTSSGMTVTLATPGPGTSRLLVMSESDAVTFNPTDGVSYPVLPDYSGPDLGAGDKAVGVGAGPFVISGLASNTVYHFAVFEFNGTAGSGEENYNTTEAVASRFTLHATEPGAVTTTLSFSAVTANSITVTAATPGPGSSRLVVVSEGEAVSFNPVDGVSYPAGLDYSTGPFVGDGDDKVIGIGSGPFIITNLTGDQTYYFAVFEFNGTDGTGAENYNTTEATAIRNTEPTVQASGLNITGVTETAMTLNWTNGNGDRKLVLISETGVFTDPTDFTNYTANSDFNNGSPTGTAIGAGWVVYDGDGSTPNVTVTNLEPGTNYHFVVYEYNGADVTTAAYMTPSSGSATAMTNVDVTPPAVLTVGTVVAFGGRVVPAYWNSTNTELHVTVPLTNTDGTLDGGSIQVMVQMTSGALAPVPGTGFHSPITTLERAAGFVTIEIDAADLESTTGFTDGDAGGFHTGSGETEHLITAAVVEDNAGNPASFNPSPTTLDVDQSPPTITNPVIVAPSAGSGGRDVIQFLVSEPLTDHAATPVERIDGFQFISSSNAYGADGISVGGGTSTGLTDDVRYVYQGATNTIEPTFINTRLIFIESVDAAATWSELTNVNVQYDQGPPGSSSNFVMRDPAGNEIGAVTLAAANRAITVGNATEPVAGAVFNSTSQQTVFAFSLTNDGTTSVTLQSLSILPSVSPTGLLSDFRLYRNTISDDHTTAIQIATASSVTSTVNFTGGIASLPAGTTRYYYLKANVESYFPTAAPTISFSMQASPLPNAGGGFTVTAGGYDGTAQTGPTYTLTDITAPTATVTRDTPLIFTGDVVQIVTVTYSEPMNTSTAPVVIFSPAVSGFSAPAGSWSSSTVWTRTYTHSGQQDIANVVASVANASGAKDINGNDEIGGSAVAFNVDTDIPEITAIYPPDLSNGIPDYYTTGEVVRIQIYFNQQITVTGSPLLVLNAGGGATATYVSDLGTFLEFQYTVAPGQNAASLAVTSINLNGGTIRDDNQNNVDLAVTTPNNLAAYAASGDAPSTIYVDTQAPSVISVSSTASDGYYKQGQTIFINVLFSEPVFVNTTFGIPRLALNPSGGTALAYYNSGSGTSTLTFRYDIQSGENVDDLDYVNTGSLTLAGGTILDVVDINAVLTLPAPGGANSISDNQTIDIDTILPTILTSTINGGLLAGIGSSNGTTASAVTFTVTFNEPVTGVDASDFIVNSLVYGGFPAYPAVVGVIPGGGISPSVGPAAVYTITVNVVSGSGVLRLDLDESGSILDAASNDNDVPFDVAGESYSIVRPEPSDNPTLPGAVAISPTQVTVSWANTFTGVLPTHLLITATGPAAGTEIVPGEFIPTNAIAPGASSEEGFADGLGYRVVSFVTSPGATSTTFNSLRSGKPYTFKIYPYSLSPNNSNDNVNYKTTGNVTAAATTQTAAQGSLTPFAGAPTTISSLSTTFGSVNFAFRIRDDGLSLTSDDAKTAITQIVIKANPTATQVTNWSEVIEEAELVEITENAGIQILASGSAITANTITFDLSTHTGTNEPGQLDDNEFKDYQLRIRLKTTFGGNAPQNVDGQRFEFLVSAAAPNSFSYEPNSSTIALSQFANSDNANAEVNNRVNVIATQFDFSTDVPTSAMVSKPVISTSLPPDGLTRPVVRARDIRGNTDRAYNATLDLTNTDGIPMSDGTFAVSALAMNSGVAVFPTGFQYSDDGDGQLTVHSAFVNESLALIPDKLSGAITVNYSTNTTIGVGAEAEGLVISSLETAPGGVLVFDFSVNDQNAGVSDDGAPTRLSTIIIRRDGVEIPNWADAIAYARLHNVEDNRDIILTAPDASIAGSTLTFAGIPNTSPTNFGYVPAGQTRNYQLWIHLFPTLGGTLQDDIDNKHFHFKVEETTGGVVLDPLSSKLTPGGTTHSDSDGGTNNKVEVITTKLVFTTEPPTDPLDVLVNTNLTSIPVVEAQDARGNRDVDYTPSGANVVITNAGGLGMTNKPTAFVGGVLDFAVPGNFQYTDIGNGDGTLTVTTTVNAANGSVPAPAVSNDVDVRVAQATTITFVASTPATISSITNATPGVTVFEFAIEDDGGSEDDGSPTQITNLTIYAGGGDQIAYSPNYNWTYAIAGATLSDGTTTVPVTTIGTDFLYFDLTAATGPALGNIDNDDTETFTLKIWLRDNIYTDNVLLTTEIDGLHFEFDIHEGNISTDPTKSLFAPGQTANSGAGNIVDVTATQLDFTTSSGSASLNVPYPAVIEARDANRNRDLGFEGAPKAITALTNATAQTVLSTPPVVGSTFTDGVFVFPGDFQFTSGNNQDDVAMEMVAGGISTITYNPTTPPLFTPKILLSSSFESVLIVDPAFVPTANIRYENFQDIITSSVALAQFKLFDGPSSGTGDSDGASTNIDDITFTVTNPANIRSLAIYKGASHVQTKNNADFSTTAGVTSVTFTNLLLDLVAPDALPRSVVFTVRASFFNSAPAVHDNDILQLQVTNVTQDGGSKFPLALPIGGVAGGAVSDGNVRVEVMAQALNFIVQPAPYSGINEAIPVEPTARARDLNQVVDEDVTGAAGAVTVTSGAGMTSIPSNFLVGELTFPGFFYNSVGDGTINLSAVNGDGATITGTSSHVDVVHVRAVKANNGLVTSAPTFGLSGGDQNKAIYGVTFKADYTSPGQPKLTGFDIDFITTGTINAAFTNMKVVRSSDLIYQAASDVDVTSLPGATVVTVGKTMQVNFGASAQDLSSAPNGEITFFLVASVLETVTSGTPTIQPKIEDLGFGATNADIRVSQGSSSSTVNGTIYNFASISAPVIVQSFPRIGQTNLDPDQTTLNLVFSIPVFCKGPRTIMLVPKLNPAGAVALTAINGIDPGGGAKPSEGKVTNPIQFAFPTSTTDKLKPDTEYYITIGSNVIVGESNPMLPITFSDVFYFKTAGTNAPKLLTAPAPDIINESLTGGTITATFDKPGKAFFMVLQNLAATPSAAQLKDPTTYPGYPATVAFDGTFNIDQVSPLSQFGLITAALTSSTTYAVWMYAESYKVSTTSTAPLVEIATPITNSGPFGGNSSAFTPGGGGPTLSLITPAGPSGAIEIFAPSLNLCSNSFQTMNLPITIVEGGTGDFNTGGALKTFNLLLPNGYQFDISSTLGVPNHGKLTLTGTDFDLTSGSLTYLNNSIVTIRFRSTGSATRDNISITGLRILSASQAPAGNLTRLGGDALLSLADGTVFATVLNYDAPTINFTNDYSKLVFPNENPPITIIPDNAGTLKLIPVPDPDYLNYGASIFGGAGVNVNEINLAAVSIDVPFTVTMTHTDNNGCVSQNAVQYTVYDHTTAIGDMETEYCIVNSNFPGTAPTGEDVKLISADNNASKNSFMIDLKATLPQSGRLMSKDNPDWVEAIEDDPLLPNDPHLLELDGVAEDIFQDGTQFKQSYKYDVAKLLNPSFVKSYDTLERTSPQGQKYWVSDTLGIIEFTGRYVNESNRQLIFPLKQNVVFWLQAVPLVEVSQTNLADGTQSKTIFCQDGGLINIFGYPEAESGTFTGSFKLYDEATYNPATSTALPTTGFTDFANGKATLDPKVNFNGFKEIRIVYTYRAAGSPCESTGYLVIRITPNPVARYTSSTPACIGIPVEFNGSSSDFGPSVTGFTVNKWDWTFADPSNISSSNPNSATGVSPKHTYAQSALYQPTLTVTSTFGCKSPVIALADLPTIKVGAIPVAKFSFTGISIDDDISFTNESTVPSAGSVGDGFGSLSWTFGDGTTKNVTANFAAPSTNKYAAPGDYDVELIVKSIIGCADTLNREVIILDYREVTDTQFYEERFDATDGNWQVAKYDTASTVSPSWRWQPPAPTNTAIVLSPQNGTKLWITSNNEGKYNGQEKSAIYSPSFNMTDPELTRPMISLWTSRQLESADGVVVEFSHDDRNVADPEKEWIVLLDKAAFTSAFDGVASGDLWYNGQGLASQPGGVQTTGFGWTGSHEVDDIGWKFSKHVLDTLLQYPREHVVFRLALSSVSDEPRFEGFAFDDVRIGNRTRTVLVENFTNLGGNENGEKDQSEVLKNFNPGGAGTRLVKINYHVGFPWKDPFNLDNPQDPGARALYYGVKTTPHAELDGWSPEVDELFSGWGKQVYNTRTLKLSEARIVPTAIVQNGSIIVNVGIEGIIQGVDVPPRTILHVAIVERQISSTNIPTAMSDLVKTKETSFEYVLKKMLPSAVGTRLTDGITFGQPMVNIGPFTWEPDLDRLYLPQNDLSVIVFLQNESTREIYQTEIIDVNDPGIVTGLEDGLRIEDIEVYPNPSDREMNILLPRKAIGPVRLRLIDQVGKPVVTDMIPDGERERNLGVQDLATGVYILQVEENGRTTHRKVMITH